MVCVDTAVRLLVNQNSKVRIFNTPYLLDPTLKPDLYNHW